MAAVTHGVNRLTRQSGWGAKGDENRRELRCAGSRLELGSLCVYNLWVLRKLAILSTCVGLATSVVACKKSAGSAESDIDNKAFDKSFDDSEPAAADRKPVEGVDLGQLNDGQKKRFENLIDKLASPCGKAHSLRTSKNTDSSCIRAPFALRYVAQMLRDGLTDKEVGKWYGNVYGEQKNQRAFKLDGAPSMGPDDAPVVMVEFFDYGCPACKAFAPELEQAIAAYPNDVVVYYKQFPLSAHPDSGPAAQAALAAHAQGKFKEMHALLFRNSPRHKLPALKAYAQQIGLDMDKFDADYAAAAARVTADKNEGISAEVASTPTTFINGIPYEAPHVADYIKIFIDEAAALRR